MIQLEPGEPDNYFALAKIYEDAGAYENAEEILLKAKEAKPDDPAVYMTLAGYYNRQGQFEKTIKQLEERAEPRAEEPRSALHVATFYWDEAFRDTHAEGGPEEGIPPERASARSTRPSRSSRTTRSARLSRGCCCACRRIWRRTRPYSSGSIKEATVLRDKAEDLRKKKTAGVGN